MDPPDAANGPDDDTRAAFEIALERFKEKLSEEKRAQFAAVTRAELDRSVNLIEKRMARPGKTMHMKRLDAFFSATNLLANCLDVLANGNEIMAFVWGPVKLILKTAQRLPDAFHSILDMYKRIGETLQIVSRYEKLACKDRYIWSHLQLIYEDILDFHSRALRRFDSPFWHQIWNNISRSFDQEFQFVLNNMLRHENGLHAHSTLTDIESTKMLRDELRQKLEAHVQKEQAQKQRLVSQWLDTFDASQVHREKAQCRDPNLDSGSWFINHSHFRDFAAPIESPCPSPTLWVYGMPGIGKTVLATKIVDHLTLLDRTVALFFYFEQNDPLRNSFVAAVRNILGQILQTSFQGRDMVIDILCEACASPGTQTTLSSEAKAREILQAAVDSMISSRHSVVDKGIDRVFILLDGLDECPSQKQKAIIRGFLDLVQSSCHAKSDRVRCIFLSQPDRISTKLLASSRCIEIEKHHVETDIKAFVSKKCNALKLRFPTLSSQHANRLEGELVRNSDGMFLYATLVLKLLASKRNAREIVEEMEGSGLPKGLLEAYSRVCRRILHDDQRYKSSAKSLLNLLVAAKRPLKWHEIQGYAAVNLKDDMFDDMSYFQQKATELCGSLVQVRDSGRVEFIHGTTKRCLLELREIDETYAESLLAFKCLSYLQLGGFHLDQDQEEIKQLVIRGHYSFMDYAACSWLLHLQALCYSADARMRIEAEHVGFDETLDCFIDLFWADNDEQIEIGDEVQEMISSGLYKMSNSTQCSEAFQAQLDQFGSMSKDAAVNKKSTMPVVVSQIRQVMEDMAPPDTKILELYGANLFKCPRINCGRYAEGFSSRADLEAHQNRHDRPHRCSFPECLWEDIGFGSEKEKRTHERDKHGLDDAEVDESSFPDYKDYLRATRTYKRQKIISARANDTSLTCTECNKSFSKRSNLNSHLKKHAQQRSGTFHTCSVASCGKRFIRTSDLQRHAQSQHGGSVLACRFRVPHTSCKIGCGRSGYKRQDALIAHLSDCAGKSCLEELLAWMPILNIMHQSNLTPKLYQCGQSTASGAWGCSQSFRDSSELLAHWKTSFRCIKDLLCRDAEEGETEPNLSQ